MRRLIRPPLSFTFTGMRIAKPMLLTMTPIGLAWGLIEAARFHWWLAVLMAVLLGAIGLFTWGVVRRIRAEREGGEPGS